MSRGGRGPVAEVGPLPQVGAAVTIEAASGADWQGEVVAVDERAITLTAPRIGGRLVELSPGRELLLVYAQRDVPCELDAVWDQGPLDTVDGKVVVFRVRGVPRRMQRRETVRVPVQLVVRASVADAEGTPPASGVSAATENLSASGILLRMNDPLPVGSELLVTLQPPGEPREPMELAGRVVRCDRYPEASRAHPWRVAVAFLDPTREQQDRLMRYIFQVQREQRARERGLS